MYTHERHIDMNVDQGLHFIAAIVVEGEKMPWIIAETTAIVCRMYNVIFILFTVHYYFDT
jgi:hypothetical protein